MVPGAPLAILASLLAADPPADAHTEIQTGGALASLEEEQAGLFARVAPSVVLLVGSGASGSGFAVTGDGLVLTNAHVVGAADEVGVQLLDGRHGRGRVVARASGALDLALVQLPFDDVPPLLAGDPSALRAGTFAATVGHGGGAAWTLSTGLVANPRPLGDGAPLLLAQMALRPGSSGGPLVDRLGRAVGIVTAGTRDASGVTFAVRIDAAAAAFPQLAAWGAPRGSPLPPGRVAARSVEESPPVVSAELSRRTSEVTPLASEVERPPKMVTVWEARRTGRRPPPRASVPSHGDRASLPAARSALPAGASGSVPPAVAALTGVALVLVALGLARRST